MKNLKLKLAAFAGAALMTLGVNAQIDRSQMPEAGPEPEINLSKPDEFQLKNGITVMVVENNKLPRVSYQLSIDNNPYKEGDKAGVASILSAMLGNGTTSISKDEFNDEVDFLGANINFGSSGGFASGLVKYADRIVELMADAAINPLLTEEEFQKEKDKLIENLKTDEKSLDAAASRVGGALSYGKDHVYGEFTTEETVNNVTYQDVLDFYKVRFAPNNAYIVVVGDIDTKTAKKQLKKYFGKWEKVENLPVIPNPELTSNVSSTEINFVDMPNATQSNISVTNNVSLKQSDDDYFAALMANNILGGGGEGYLFKNLREDKGYTYGAYSSLGANRYGVSRFNARAKVRNAVTDSAVVEFLKEIKRIRTEPVDPTTLKNAKAKYVGNFVMALERPQTIANYALNIKRNNLPEDFYAKYLENINNVSVEDVQRVANKYFKADNARVVVVGKGADVLPNLEKVGLPIKYYDKYANATEKPQMSTMPEGVDVKSILGNYLEAAGVKANMEKIQSIMTQYEATTPMGAIVQEEKRIDGKTNQSMYVGGNKMVTMIMTQEGATANNQPLPENMTNDMKPYAGLFMERNLLKSDVAKLSGIEKVDGKDAYVVDVPGEIVSFRLFYDVESGLKVKEVQTTNIQGQSQTQEAILKDYKDYSGIKFPETRAATMMGQSVEFKLKEVKINEGVTDADFGN